VTNILISLHLPKTAGESFSRTLSDFYGVRLGKDYADYPINTSVQTRNKQALHYTLDAAFQNNVTSSDCIHGHFLPLKYLQYNDINPNANKRWFITWMRHPVDRLISHYYYWIERSALNSHASLHRRVVEEKWSLEKFCFAPELQNLYEQFLWGFPIRYFDFIGITEHYASDLQYFSSKYLNTNSNMYSENRRSMEKKGYSISDSLRKKIELFHEKDMQLYARACEQRLSRI
jgi:hypothetical protein